VEGIAQRSLDILRRAPAKHRKTQEERNYPTHKRPDDLDLAANAVVKSCHA
jgi:hypothetical protein